MAYCQPNVTCTEDNHTYITDFKCLNLNAELEDALKSFPSAHASFAAYAAFFLVLYIQERFQAFGHCLTLKTVIGPFLQLSIIASFWWSALTRVSDYVHHPVDVLAGLVLGTLVAFWTRLYLQYFIQAIDKNHKTLKYSLTWMLSSLISSLTWNTTWDNFRTLALFNNQQGDKKYIMRAFKLAKTRVEFFWVVSQDKLGQILVQLHCPLDVGHVI